MRPSVGIVGCALPLAMLACSIEPLGVGDDTGGRSDLRHVVAWEIRTAADGRIIADGLDADGALHAQLTETVTENELTLEVWTVDEASGTVTLSESGAANAGPALGTEFSREAVGLLEEVARGADVLAAARSPRAGESCLPRGLLRVLPGTCGKLWAAGGVGALVGLVLLFYAPIGAGAWVFWGVVVGGSSTLAASTIATLVLHELGECDRGPSHRIDWELTAKKIGYPFCPATP